jgi:hypothetical protein
MLWLKIGLLNLGVAILCHKVCITQGFRAGPADKAPGGKEGLVVKPVKKIQKRNTKKK